MKIQAITLEEWKYTYSQSQQIAGMTGCIGHLRGDFDKDGLGFYSTWFDRRSDLKTTEFKQDIDKVVNELRSDKCGILKDLFSMKKYVKDYPDSGLHGNYCTEYGFRIMTEKYIYLLRCNINPGDYNFYCYCYITEWFDKHIKNAENGIRFITPHYRELFRIPDGGKILIQDSKGEKREVICRYIDEYHVEIGNYLYHICEFAERMENIGSKCSPLT